MWVDKKYLTTISKIEGVTAILPSELMGCNIVTVDKRYDIQDVKAAIIQFVNVSEEALIPTLFPDALAIPSDPVSINNE